MPGFFTENGPENNENPGKSDEPSPFANGLGERPKSVSHSYTLPRPEINPQVISAWIRLLSEMVGVRLRQQNLAARTIHFYLSGPQIGSFGAQNTNKIATSEAMKYT